MGRATFAAADTPLDSEGEMPLAQICREQINLQNTESSFCPPGMLPAPSHSLFCTFTSSCSSAGLPGYLPTLPIREPTTHAFNLVSLKLKTSSTELVLFRDAVL